jgi:hypothetical protein
MSSSSTATAHRRTSSASLLRMTCRRDIGSDTALDTLFRAATDPRSGDAYTEADCVIVNPSDYEEIRLSKDENNNYLLGNPLSAAPPSMDGAKFVITTRIDQGTAIVANLATACRVYIREYPRWKITRTGAARLSL